MKKAKKSSQKKKPHQLVNDNQLYEEFASHFIAASKFLAQGKLLEAEKSYRRAIALRGDFAETYNNLGIVLQEQGKFDAAIECHKRAIAIKANCPEAFQNLGVAFRAQKKFDLAIENYQKAIKLKPDYTDALDDLFHTRLRCCDWTGYASSLEKARKIVNNNQPGISPFGFLSISNSAAEQLKCAQNFISKTILHSKESLSAGQRYKHKKIRVAYISADFRQHPVSFLMAGLFEAHDKKHFEIIGISLKPEDKSVIGQRVKNAFSRFIDVSHLGNYEIAVLIRDLEIDIAVDLMGLTGKSRTEIFSYQPASIQVNYLGYPGTIGAVYMDYILADKHIIPTEQHDCYAEKVVYLPDSYMVTDFKMAVAEQTPTRTEVNLPENGFVFCCFNNSYKINPEMFTTWMRLLNKVENSVLWLGESNSFAADNLRKEAKLRGISPERLIFASRVDKIEEHRARQRLADLFLDALPYNAHSTTCDALWVGLPVLTCMGSAFAGRVAGSLLHAIGLSELITYNLKEYEALALKLATHPDLLADIKEKLAKNRSAYPLFNTSRFCQHLEAAYMTMWERCQRGESPASFLVPAIE
jgi:predicted O-linked N-acetylglucosamine transferase (SPINDLY family)